MSFKQSGGAQFEWNTLELVTVLHPCRHESSRLPSWSAGWLDCLLSTAEGNHRELLLFPTKQLTHSLKQQRKQNKVQRQDRQERREVFYTTRMQWTVVANTCEFTLWHDIFQIRDYRKSISFSNLKKTLHSAVVIQSNTSLNFYLRQKIACMCDGCRATRVLLHKA